MKDNEGFKELIRGLVGILPSEITIWSQKEIIYSNKVNYSKQIRDWPLVEAGQKKSYPIGIYAPGMHELCGECKHKKNCPLELEIFFPFVDQGEVKGGIQFELGPSGANRFKDFAQQSWILFLKGFAASVYRFIREDAQQKQQALMEQQMNYLLDLVPEGIAIFDKDKSPIFSNKMAEKMELAKLIGSSELRETFMKVLPLEMKSPLGQSEVMLKGQPFFYNRFFMGAVVHSEGLTPQTKDHWVEPKRFFLSHIIGKDSSLLRVIEITKQAARSDSTILIRGESGTGKEMFAKAIHRASPRAGGPFVAINCAAIPESLLESELFGYEEGSFTGAKRGGKSGKVELANQGTLFLDEIGDMPLSLQAKLLRVIQEKRIERVGGSKPLNVNIRLVAATHRNLEEMIKEGTFREDLFFRLSVIPLFIPSLRERKEDVDLLLHYFLKKYCIKMGRDFKIFSYSALKALREYDWPGNVRELENMVEYLVNIHPKDVITLEDLPLNFKRNISTLKENDVRKDDSLKGSRLSIHGEKERLIEVLNANGWDTEGKKRAAHSLGISIATLYRWIKKYKVEG